MDTILKTLKRNRLSSDTDQDKSAGKNEHTTDGDPDASMEAKPGRARLSTTDYEQYDDNGDLIVGIPEENGDIEDDVLQQEKKMHVSIDCTKALVILGFANWSELEPGEYQA